MCDSTDSIIHFGGQVCMEKQSTKEERLEYAAMMLAWFLAEEPKPYDEVKEHCVKLGITRFELKAARKELNVKTTSTGSTWLWEVPDPDKEVDTK